MTAVEYLKNEIQRMQEQSENDWQSGYQFALTDVLHLIEQAKQMEKDQVEISDEEIEKAIIDQDIVKQEGYCHCFLEGAQWYREQLKQKL